jgi:uroporphyrinogen decarboxylase
MKLLDALQGKNRGRPPVWLMRQAGRYLPEYRALRANHTLREMFFTPSLAADVTLMPIRRFCFDAAILFSDITAIAPALGYSLAFQEGPMVEPEATLLNWRDRNRNLALLDPIAEAALLVKQQLDVPLIGFCGGPFTIATYLTGGKTQEWMGSNPEEFDAFLESIAQMCVHSLQTQIAAGADAVQIFDSWADQLDDTQFDRWSLRWFTKIASAVEKPVILFMRGSSERYEKLAKIPNVCISLDPGKKVSDVRKSVKCPLQGNLDPDLLFKGVVEVRQSVNQLLCEMEGDPGFIVNLGHGVKPGTPLEAVEALVAEIKKPRDSSLSS